jgi:hypothetical protein
MQRIIARSSIYIATKSRVREARKRGRESKQILTLPSSTGRQNSNGHLVGKHREERERRRGEMQRGGGRKEGKKARELPT